MTSPKSRPVEATAALIERAILDGALAKMRTTHGWGKRNAADVVRLLAAHVALRDAS